MPSQQLTLATYVLLALVAVEAIVAFNILTWKQSSEAARRRRAARDRHLAQQHALAAGRRRHDLPVQQQDAAGAPAGPPSAPAAGGSPAREGSEEGGGTGSPGPGGGKGWASASGRRPARLGSIKQGLEDDAEYDAYLAWIFDLTALAVLAVGYAVTAVLIFVLQSGFIPLFS